MDVGLPKPAPLIVGEMNGHSADPRFALWPRPAGCAGARLVAHLGLSEREYLDRFSRANLLPGGRWSVAAARKAALRLDRAIMPGIPIVLLGRRVAAAFGLDSPNIPAALHCDGPSGVRRTWVLLPHPSGRCRSWNGPGVRKAVRQVMAPWLGEREVR